MKYPNFLQNGDIIGITALSAGVGEKIESFELSIDNLKKNGFNILETSNVRNESFVSSSAEKRVEELNQLVLNKDVKMVLCAAGGDFLIEVLPKLNLENIKNNEKWFMGYSDPSTLLHLITTKLDIATIYGHNFSSLGTETYHKSHIDFLEIIKGNLLEQHNYDLYEDIPFETITGLEGYNVTEKVYWHTLENKDISVE